MRKAPTNVHPQSKGKKAIRHVSDTRRTSLRKGKCSKGQQRTATLMSYMLNGSDYEMEVTWDWLITEHYVGMYTDVYFPKYKLVIEYHGEQHYKYPNFWHKTKKEFDEAKGRDRLKKKLLLSHRIKFIEWKFSQPFTEKRALEKLIEAGVPEDKIRKPKPQKRVNKKLEKSLKVVPRSIRSRFT